MVAVTSNTPLKLLAFSRRSVARRGRSWLYPRAASAGSVSGGCLGGKPVHGHRGPDRRWQDQSGNPAGAAIHRAVDPRERRRKSVSGKLLRGPSEICVPDAAVFPALALSPAAGAVSTGPLQQRYAQRLPLRQGSDL